MSQESRYIKRANEILRDLDGVFPGGDGVHQQFQWMWSDSLMSILPVYEIVNGRAQEVMDYRCMCGTNVMVHQINCSGAVIAKVRMQKVKTCGDTGEYSTYRNCWLFCCWAAPPSKQDWIDSMGTDEDYPENGRYLPVSQGPACVAIPPNTSPQLYEEISHLTVKKMIAHSQSWRAALQKSFEKKTALQIPIEDSRGNVIREPEKDARYWNIYARIKERLLKYDPRATVAYTGALKNKEI